jgi:hypothetical protein
MGRRLPDAAIIRATPVFDAIEGEPRPEDDRIDLGDDPVTASSRTATSSPRATVFASSSQK